MTKSFLPEYSQMPVGSRYRPLFRLFADEAWKFVRKDGKPIECDTAGQAVEAAKECVKLILNPPIRAEKLTCDPEPAIDLGIDEWRQRREQEAAEERARLFGSEGTTIYLGHGRTAVVVEHRHRRRA
jgi:hypothetical protein